MSTVRFSKSRKWSLFLGVFRFASHSLFVSGFILLVTWKRQGKAKASFLSLLFSVFFTLVTISLVSLVG